MHKEWIYVIGKDILFESDFRFAERWKPKTVDENTKVEPISVCFITLDDRGEKSKYIQLHNNSLNAYVQYRNMKNSGHIYTYKFLDTCHSPHFPHKCNPYWCKIFVVREILENENYDYVVWLDSDTVIKDPEIEFADILSKHKSDFFTGTDSSEKSMFDTINAGVFAVRNSNIGRNILQDLCNVYTDENFQNYCVMNDGKKLRGIWARTCYEQGMMNEILYKKYFKNTTILGSEWIYNSRKCDGEFIIHLNGETEESRKKCFDKYITPKTCWL